MPVLVICETCGTHYNLKDEHLGSRLKCKHCGTVMAVAKAADDVNLQIDRDYDQAFNRDKFFLNQNRISISEKYYVFDENKNPILFILRPAHFLKNVVAALAAVLTMLLIAGGFSALGIYLDNLGYKPVGMITIILGLVVGLALTCIVGVRLSPKRHIYVYSDDTKSRLLLEILQDYKVSFIRAYYTVVDPIDGVIGRFEKNYLYNLIRKRWTASAPDGSPLVLAKEDSVILALLRRFLGTFFGLLRTNFVILRPGTETVIGEFNRRFTIFDRYVLDLSGDRAHELDRRMAIALGVLLDTGERR